MLWRAWCFLAGLPLGALAVLAWTPGAPLAAVELGAAAGGIVLLAVAWAVARQRDDDPDRGRHLATTAGVAFAALPLLGAGVLGIGPPFAVAAALAVLVLAVALARGAWRRGPGGGPARWALVGAASALAGAGASLAWTGIGGAFAPSPPPPTPQQVKAVYDLDARVVTRPIPRCAARPARIEPLLDRGAHPRLAAEGRVLWLDARAGDGRRQVHRLDRESGRLQCWTCDEDGSNQRPAPTEDGAGLVFETDRWATLRDPANTELQLASGAGEAPEIGSRRLTVSPGPDERALFGPGGGLLVWSHGRDGRYDVVAAPLRSGHGGVLLGKPRTLFPGGAAWTAPLAWSPDARMLLVVRGNPLRPLEALALDLVSGEPAWIGRELPGSASVSFSGDGGWIALPTATRARVAGLLPVWLAFAVAPLERLALGDAPRFEGGGVRVGEPWGEGADLDLGPDAAWGEPTGVALEPDGRAFVLAQRRAGPSGIEERMVRVVLDCASPGGV